MHNSSSAIVREVRRLYVCNVSAYGVGYDRVEVGVLAQELRLEALVHAEHVGIYEHLSVAFVASSDADGGAAYGCRNLLGEVCRYLLEHDAAASCLFERLCVGYELLCFSLLLGAQAVSAELVNALRSESEVSAYGYARSHDLFDHRSYLCSAFELHAVDASLLHDAYSVAYAVLF